jgi:hypothetical protein
METTMNDRSMLLFQWGKEKNGSVSPNSALQYGVRSLEPLSNNIQLNHFLDIRSQFMGLGTSWVRALWINAATAGSLID